MREHVRQLIHDAQQRESASLGAEAVRLARLAAAIHAAQAGQRIAMTHTTHAPAQLQEHVR